MNINIRKLSKDDIDYCIEIYKLNAENNLKYLDQLIYELNSSFLDFNFIVPKFLIAEHNNEILGFAGYSNTGFSNAVYGIFWINVHPNYKNIGVGKSLTKFRIEAIKNEGGKVILSTTKKAWHLERFGFQKISLLTGGSILMKLELQ